MCVSCWLFPLRHKLDTWRVGGVEWRVGVGHHTVPNFFLASDKLPYSSIIGIGIGPCFF